MSLNWFDEILHGKLLLGSMPLMHDDILELERSGVSAVLSVQEEGEYFTSLPEMKNFRWMRLPIKDSYLGGMPTIEQIEEGAAILYQWIDVDQETVYVHCFTGQQRSPLICVGYLTMHWQLSLEAAIGLVTMKRTQVRFDEQHLQLLTSLLSIEKKNIFL